MRVISTHGARRDARHAEDALDGERNLPVILDEDESTFGVKELQREDFDVLHGDYG